MIVGTISVLILPSDSVRIGIYLLLGLTRQDGSHKASFEYYQQMNGGNAGAYIQKAAATLGIADWNAAMHAR